MASSILARATVHPRACGEQLYRRISKRESAGSSPRLRGTVPPEPGLPGQFRFIPAPAGNRRLSLNAPCTNSVHPRACGEQPLRDITVAVHVGSSPRLRGTDLLGAERDVRIRFIPAPAGNSHLLRPKHYHSTVHPRACGEQAGNVNAIGAANGSSPRLRGTVLPKLPRGLANRFIPAPAGNRH